MALPEVWDDPTRLKQLHREQKSLKLWLEPIAHLEQLLNGLEDLLAMAEQESDQEMQEVCKEQAQEASNLLDQLEFQRMFSEDHDKSSAYMDIQAGSGGVEAQDWAKMLMRMYMRWAESHGFDVQINDAHTGDVAGMKSVTLLIQGDYAYGWLKYETGVHRLVRKSPFDSGNRRHTSFASVFLTPEIDESVSVEINSSDLRIDTYRSSGAGGQHVNTTDSAIRITHAPSGIVVQCQNERSQHQNKAKAMEQLKAKLHQKAMDEAQEKTKALESSKQDISWGSQIRSYVLDDGRIKDLRTGVETGDIQGVLDGKLDPFLQAALKMKLGVDPK